MIHFTHAVTDESNDIREKIAKNPDFYAIFCKVQESMAPRTVHPTMSVTYESGHLSVKIAPVASDE